MKTRDSFIHLYKHAASMCCVKMNDEESISNIKKLQIKCNRCDRIWNYKGLNPYYATCTFCKNSVNIKKNKVQDNYLVTASNHPGSTIREVTEK